MYSLTMENVSKDYNDFSIKNINLNIPKGSIVGLIGENGAGKTSILKLILNIIHKDSGKINLLGIEDIEQDRRVLENVGVFFGENYLPYELNIKKMEDIMSSIYSKWDRNKFFDYVTKFKLPKEKEFKDFSKGMRVKTALAITMSHKSKLLILDEPTIGLDPIIRDEILEVFLDYMQDEENSIIISSHITSDLEKICDYIAYIDNGELIFFLEKDELIYNYGILKCKSEDIEMIDEEDIIKKYKTSSGYNIIVSNKTLMKNKYKKFVIDDASIDEIMIIYIKAKEEN